MDTRPCKVLTGGSVLDGAFHRFSDYEEQTSDNKPYLKTYALVEVNGEVWKVEPTEVLFTDK